MKKNLTELVFILDKSGSMSGLEKDTVGGFNSMLKKQKESGGEVLVTTVLFNHETETVHDRLKAENVGALTEKEYYVGGCTALLDAVGKTVEHIKGIHKYIRAEKKFSGVEELCRQIEEDKKAIKTYFLNKKQLPDT